MYGDNYVDARRQTDRRDFDDDGRFFGQNTDRRGPSRQFDDIESSQRDNFGDEAFHARVYDADGHAYEDYLHPVYSDRPVARAPYSDSEMPKNEANFYGNRQNTTDYRRNSGERIEMMNLNSNEHLDSGRHGGPSPYYNADRTSNVNEHQFHDANYYEDFDNVTEGVRQRSEFEMFPRGVDQRSDNRGDHFYNSRQTEGGQAGYSRTDDTAVLYNDQPDYAGGHGNPGFEVEADYHDAHIYKQRVQRGVSMRRRSRKSRRERREENERDQRISFADGMKTIIQRQRKDNGGHKPVSEIDFKSRLSRPGSVFGAVNFDDEEDKLPSNKYNKRKSIKERLATLHREGNFNSNDMATLLRDQVLTREASELKGWALQKYDISMQWHRFKGWFKSWVYELELWAGAFKIIEGHFGTSTVSYFRFLRWLMFLNLFMTLFMFGLVLLPFLLLEPKGTGSFTASVNACSSTFHNEAVFYSSNYTSFVNHKVDHSSSADKIQDVLQGTGWMENTVLFYGAFFSKAGYDMPLAYMCAVGVSFLMCFILLVKNSAKGFKQRAAASVDGNITMYCNKVFGAWDYCISDPKTGHFKHSNILRDIMNELAYQRLEWKKASRTTKEKLKLYTVRFLINMLVILILGGSLYLIFFTNQKLVELEKENALNETEVLVMQFLPSVTIMLLCIIVPTLFDKMVVAEDYMPAFAIKITLIRTVLLRLASLGILMVSLYTALPPVKKKHDVLIPCDNLVSNNNSDILTTVSPTWNTTEDQNITSVAENTQENNIKCWETYFGQQIYKLVMLNFLVVIFITFALEFPRKLIHKKLHKKFKLVDFVGQQTFDLSKSVLDLVYLQTLCWLGVFFSPIIPAMCFVKCFIFFYIKKWSLLTNCSPMQQYGTTKTNSLFMMVLLLSFSLAAIPIIFMIGSIPPSQGCGPFRVYLSDNFIMFDVITNLVATSNEAQKVFSVVATPAFMAVLGFCLCLLMYYFWMVGQANYNLSQSLRDQLKIEGQDKQFLVARVNEAYAYARDFQ